MIKAVEMALDALDAPDHLDRTAALCTARAALSAGLHGSLAQAVGEKNAAVAEHTAYGESMEADIVGLKHGMASPGHDAGRRRRATGEEMRKRLPPHRAPCDPRD